MVNLSGIIAVMNRFQKFMMQTCRLESTQICINIFRYFRITSLLKSPNPFQPTFQNNC